MTVVPLRRPPAPDPAPPVAEAARAGKGHHRRRRFAWIGTAASVVLFVTSLGVLWHIASDIQPGEVTAAFTAATGRQIGLTVLFTAASYVLLTGYDGLALRQLGVRVPFRTT